MGRRSTIKQRCSRGTAPSPRHPPPLTQAPPRYPPLPPAPPPPKHPPLTRAPAPGPGRVVEPALVPQIRPHVEALQVRVGRRPLFLQDRVEAVYKEKAGSHSYGSQWDLRIMCEGLPISAVE